MARGHKVENIKQLPFVVSNDIESYTKAKQAQEFLQKVGAFADVQRVKGTKKTRAGVGKRRNRRYVQRKGPLVIFKENKGVVRAFRNIPGVDVVSVDRLNLLQLAPGGHVGRFIIWTEGAFKDLSKFGSYDRSQGNSQFVRRTGSVAWTLPEPVMKNTDVSAIIDSDAVQAVTTTPKDNLFEQKRYKINPFKSAAAMRRLNKHGIAQKRKALLGEYRARAYKQSGKAPAYVKKAIERAQKRKDRVANSAFIKSLTA